MCGVAEYRGRLSFGGKVKKYIYAIMSITAVFVVAVYLSGWQVRRGDELCGLFLGWVRACFTA